MQPTAKRGSRGMGLLLVLLILPGGAGLMAMDSGPRPDPSVEPPATAAGPAVASIRVDGESAAGAPAVESVLPAPEAEAGAGAAGTGSYRGTVIDRRSSKPVEGATLVFINEETSDSFEAVTDSKGEYSVRLPSGQYVVDIKVKKKVYRSTGTFREEATGRRWVMDFTVGTKLTEKDLRIETTPKDIRLMPTEPRPPLEASKKLMEFLIFVGGLAVVGALAN